jgi:hypothetical protein
VITARFRAPSLGAGRELCQKEKTASADGLADVAELYIISQKGYGEHNAILEQLQPRDKNVQSRQLNEKQ